MVRNNRYKLVQEDKTGHSSKRLNFHYRWCEANGYKNYEITDEIKFELYDLVNDPFEKNNIADKYPEIVEKLKREYIAGYKDVFSTRGFNRPVLKLNAHKENPEVLTSNFWLPPREWKMIVDTPGTYNIKIVWGNLKKTTRKIIFKCCRASIFNSNFRKKGKYIFKNIEIPSGFQPFQTWIDNKQNKLS